jgi:hypothetical protein
MSYGGVRKVALAYRGAANIVSVLLSTLADMGLPCRNPNDDDVLAAAAVVDVDVARRCWRLASSCPFALSHGTVFCPNCHPTGKAPTGWLWRMSGLDAGVVARTVFRIVGNTLSGYYLFFTMEEAAFCTGFGGRSGA